METLHHHYARLLGLDDSWRVEAVNLELEKKRAEIRLAHSGGRVVCPECGALCGVADHAEERRWRHLDTMQFATELAARLPRSRCPEHGVKTVAAPWTGKYSRFTLLFGASAVQVLLACKNVKGAAVAAKAPQAGLVHDKFHVAKPTIGGLRLLVAAFVASTHSRNPQILAGLLVAFFQ